MKYFVGFFIGILIASAVADTVGGLVLLPMDPPYLSAVLSAGVGPDNRMAPIRVDEDGYVICSKRVLP